MTLALGHKSVKEMLRSIDSTELTEWLAFEKEYGPIDNVWRDTVLREIHTAIQIGNTYFLQANSEEDIDAPIPLPLPWEVVNTRRTEDDG